MKYYVDIVYIMIINRVIIAKNKKILEKKIIKAYGLSNVKKASGLSNVKRANGLKSVKGFGLKILSWFKKYNI